VAYAASRERPVEPYQFPERWKSKPRFHRERESIYIPLSPSPNLSIFHSFPGFMLEGGGGVHQRRSNTEN